MASQKEAIDLPICMHGFSIRDGFLMQTRRTHREYGMSGQALYTAICFFTTHYFDSVQVDFHASGLTVVSQLYETGKAGR